MAKRPTLSESLKASLSKGVHVETAERIAQGLPPVDDQPLPSVLTLPDKTISQITSEPIIQEATIPTVQPADNPDNDPDYQPVVNPGHYPDVTGLSTGQSTGQEALQPINDKANCPVEEPVRYPHLYPVNKSAKQLLKDPVSFNSKNVDPELWYPFTEKQGRILLYLLQAGGKANRNNISADTGINIATVKHTMRVLAKDGYIGNVKLYVEHSLRGFTYTVNQAMCAEFASRFGRHYQANYQANNSANDTFNTLSGYPANTVVNPPDNLSVPFSSSSLKLNLTTTENADPEFGYWAATGVTERQLMNWESEFQMTRPELLQCLRYCRYDLLNNPDRQEVKSPQNWFYKTVKKAGAYPRPEGYKSLQELKIERERQELEEMERQAQELAEIRRKKKIALLDLQFQRILSDEGDEYQALLAEIKGLAKEVGGRVLESSLRAKYFEKNGVETHI